MKSLLALLSLLVIAIACPAADLTITAANVVPGANATLTRGTAGATITAGQLVYYDSAARTYKLADANASATTAAVIGLAANGASAGQPLTVIIEDDDLTVGATLSTSAPVYILSATAGGIAPVADLTTGWYPAVVLVAKSTTKAIFRAAALRGTAVATAP
jgi:hypothetical protein